MNTEDININLEKIHALHSSLNETNPQTFIIFLETYRNSLNPAQIAWIDNRIDQLTERTSSTIALTMNNIDIAMAMTPLSEKSCDQGVQVIRGDS